MDKHMGLKVTPGFERPPLSNCNHRQVTKLNFSFLVCQRPLVNHLVSRGELEVTQFPGPIMRTPSL